MGIDTELISSKLYNLKFKNRLRDFYLYQFKHNETDFYDRGSFLDARMFVGSILVNKYDITEKEMYIIQMNHIQYDSENDEIRILIGEQSSDTAPRVINVCQPFSQMVLLLRNRNTTELFLTGNKTKPITKNNIARFRDALKKYEELREKNSDELFDYWEQIYLSTVNKAVTASTFRNDSTRLNNIIAPLAGVEWRHGSIVGFKKGEILPDKVNKHVECVTVDGKSITKNPFQELYKCCLEDSTYLGQSFLLTYFLILHFHLGSALERYDNVPFKKEELSTLNNHFKETAATLESKTRGRDPRSWSSLSQEEKCFFGKMALEKFEIVHIENRNETAKRKYDGIEESDEIKRIYDKVLLHNKKVALVDNNFVVEDKSPLQTSFVEKNILYDIYIKYVNSEGLDEKQFGNNLNKLIRMGILLSKKQGERLYYALSNVFLGEILGNNEDLSTRFAEMVTFFSQILPLGEIGNYISNRITNNSIQYMKFKHRYLTRALNDYNIIDLLNAIDQKKWIEIEYRNASVVDLKYQKFVCLPLEIRESVIDGRQYLLYYHPNFRSVSAARVEFIDSIKLGEIKEEPFIQEDLERAEELIAYTWGTSFGDFKNGNVKKRPQINRVRAIIKCAENEFYIKNRVQRECRNCISIKSITDVKNGHCFELLVELVNFKEFMQWLRSLTCRVVSIEVNGTEYFRFYDDIIRTARLYHITELNRLCDDEKIAYEKETLIEFKNEFEEFNSLHDMLFNEMFSEPFYMVGCVLFDLFKQDNVDKEDIIKTYDKLWRYTVAPDRKEQLKFVLNPFVVSVKRKKGGTIWSEHEDVQIPALSFKYNCEIGSMWDLIPLTKVEIQWIQNILCHPLAKCFLTPNEIKKIKFNLPKMNLFDVNKVVLHDQFLDMGSFYARIDFGDTVRTILQAIREKRAINMQYKDQYGVCAQLLCYPSHIEYSKRDNKIRIIGVREDVVRTYNIERIQNVSISDDYFDYNAVTEMINAYDANECNIKVFFKEIKNVPDRILTEFSCYRKTCSKFKNNEYEYQMTLYYKKEEAKEILVRLLSYGPYIKLGEDHDAEGHNGAVKTEYLDRIERQLELIKSREMVRETIAKRHSELQR